MPSSSDPRPSPQDPSRRPRVPGVESTDGPAQRGEAGLWEVVLLASVRFSWGSGPGTLAPHWADSYPSPSRGARRARAGTAGGQGAPQSRQGAEGPCRGEGWHPAGRGWAWEGGQLPCPLNPTSACRERRRSRRRPTAAQNPGMGQGGRVWAVVGPWAHHDGFPTPAPSTPEGDPSSRRQRDLSPEPEPEPEEPDGGFRKVRDPTVT